LLWAASHISPGQDFWLVKTSSETDLSGASL
jgi:hypothetical protein